MQWETKSSLKQIASARQRPSPFLGQHQPPTAVVKRSAWSVALQLARRKILVRDLKRAVDSPWVNKTR